MKKRRNKFKEIDLLKSIFLKNNRIFEKISTALPTIAGTNTLSVGTEVQPSEIEIKGKIKPI